MSRWGIGASVGLIFASLTFASGIGPAVASYECGHRYRMCNVSCNQAIVSNNAVCRLQCDLRLVTCDKTKAKDSADDDRGDTADTVHERPSPDQHTR
jgi:hypothetical protein